MRPDTPTLDEIRRRGLEALLRELGPSGMVRFLQQYENGEGDTTAERAAYDRSEDVQTLADRIRRSRDVEAE